VGQVYGAKGVPGALEDLGPNHGDGNGDGIPDRLQPGVATVPSMTTGQFVTIDAGGHALQNVQVDDAPASNVTLPWGLFGFKVTGVTPGGSATVRIILPPDAYPNSYYKEDPKTGRITPFMY